MKLGILTYHDINNFGAQLQAASLQRFIESEGFDVELIDYTPIRKEARDFMSIFRLMRELKIQAANKKRIELRDFRENIKIMARVSPSRAWTTAGLKKLSKDYDVLIAGSDEIWNFSNYFGVRPEYALDGLGSSSAKKISYASSMGGLTPNKKTDGIFKAALKNYTGILVRDPATRQMVVNLGYKANRVLDPTFLTTLTNPPKRDLVPKENYICITGQMDDAAVSEVLSYAKKENLKIFTPGYKYKGLESSYISCMPLEWVDVIGGAKLHVTSLFHGSIFSIKQKVPFYVIVPKAKQQKVQSLLELFGWPVPGDSLIANGCASKYFEPTFIQEYNDDFDEVFNRLVADSQQKLRTVLGQLR